MATRMRKAFKYPEEAEDNLSDGRDEMDEEEQSALLENLATSNQLSNRTLFPLLLSLPLISTLPFIYLLFSAKSSTPTSFRLLAFLSLTSLLGSTYVFYINGNPATNDSSAPKKAKPSEVFGSTTLPSLTSASQSPLQTYLPKLNWGLATLTAVSGSFLRRPDWNGTDVPEYYWLWSLLPAVVCVVLEVSKRAMEDVREGIVGLEGMKYDYKGA